MVGFKPNTAFVLLLVPADLNAALLIVGLLDGDSVVLPNNLLVFDVTGILYFLSLVLNIFEFHCISGTATFQMRIPFLAQPKNLHFRPDDELALNLDPGIHIVVVLVGVTLELVQFVEVRLLCFGCNGPVEVVARSVDN